jgi:hypothetical protein
MSAETRKVDVLATLRRHREECGVPGCHFCIELDACIDAVAELIESLEACVASLERADTSEGYCCCGSAVEGHELGDGHSPVDIGEYHAGLALEKARAALARVGGDA